MAVILLSFAFAIRFSLKLHDAVTGTAVLNEAMELQGHLPKTHAQAEEAEVNAYAASRLEGMLSEKRYALTLSKKGRKTIGKISGKNYQAQLSDKGFRPEEWMRKLTLLDPLRE